MAAQITLPKDAEGREMRLIGTFKKIENVAAGENAIDNLVKRLEADGWNVVSE